MYSWKEWKNQVCESKQNNKVEETYLQISRETGKKRLTREKILVNRLAHQRKKKGECYL